MTWCQLPAMKAADRCMWTVFDDLPVESFSDIAAANSRLR
jgi:hypothetical protein